MMRQIDKYICTCQVCIDKGIIKANPPQKHTKFLFGSVRSTKKHGAEPIGSALCFFRFPVIPRLAAPIFIEIIYGI